MNRRKIDIKMTKGVKILSLTNLDRRQIDLIEDVTDQEIHFWKRNDTGGLTFTLFLKNN